MSDETLAIRPQPGPQTEFLETSADVAVYGGAAGGGKTFGCLLEPLRHVNNGDFMATFFRRTYPQIKTQGGLWDEANKLYRGLGATPNKSRLEFTFPSGAKIKFAHLQYEDTVYEYQGSQIPLIVFDELTHFEESQFFYLLSRNRSTCGVRPYVRATCNPDSGSWVKKFLGPWVNPNFSGEKAKSGEIRHFIRDQGELHWVPPDERPPAKAMSCVFISATIHDNKILLENDPDYLQKLESLPLVERERLLHGNWDIDEADKRYDRDWFTILERSDPYEAQARVRYWDMAATEVEENKDACFTSGVLMARDTNGRYIIEDVRRVQYHPGDAKRLVQRTAEKDGKEVPIYIEQEPGASGKAVIHDFVQSLAGWEVHGDKPTGEKSVRSRPLEAQAEHGNLYLLKGSWNEAFLQEAEEYPLGYKDQIDAAAGALDKAAELGRFAFA